MDHSPDIREVVQLYLDGMCYADEAKLRRAFHPKAKSIGHYKGVLEWQSVDEFVDSCLEAGGLPAHEGFFSHIDSIEVAGDVAVVKVADDYLGSRFSDFLTLLRLEGRWRIVNKAFFDHGPV